MTRADWKAAEREWAKEQASLPATPRTTPALIRARRERAEETQFVAYLIAVKLTLRALPWSLLRGSEKGRRDRNEEENRAEVFARTMHEKHTARRAPILKDRPDI